FHYTSISVFYTLSLHDALPIYLKRLANAFVYSFPSLTSRKKPAIASASRKKTLCSSFMPRIFLYLILSFLSSSRTTSRSLSLRRSEEHTSELQSPCNLVCRLLL